MRKLKKPYILFKVIFGNSFSNESKKINYTTSKARFLRAFEDKSLYKISILLKINSFFLEEKFFYLKLSNLVWLSDINDIIETSNNLDAVNRALYESVDIHCFFRFSDFVEFRMNRRIFWQENRAAVFKRLD